MYLDELYIIFSTKTFSNRQPSLTKNQWTYNNIVT